MDRRVFLAAAVGGLAGCTSPTAIFGDETRTEQRTYAVDDETRLRIRSHDGSVTVESHDGDEVVLDAEIEGPSSDAVDAVSVEETQSDGELELRTEYDSDDRDASVSLTVQCPDAVVADRIRTDNGNVEVTDVAGDPELETENGSLTVENVDGTVSLTTESGSITARDVGGVAEATTSNGSVEIDVPSVPDDATVRSANGSIDAAVASDLDADVFAATSNGSVELHDLELSSERVTETSISGTLGEGTHELTFETSNGSIDLRALSE